MAGALLLGAPPAFAAEAVNNGAIGPYAITTGNDFTNNGSVTGTGVSAVTATGDVGTIVNSSDASIASDSKAIDTDFSVTSITNAGSITGLVDVGGDLEFFLNAGMMNGETRASLSVDGTTGSFVNTGKITTTGDYVLDFEAIESFFNSGEIHASGETVYIGGRVGSFTNAGLITSGQYQAIWFQQDGGSFTNSGRITGDEKAVDFGGSVGTFFNAGTIISGNSYALNVGGGVTGSFFNSGLIASTSEKSIYIRSGVSTFTNSGTISGGGDGVDISGGVSAFTNSGTISGGEDGVHIDGGVSAFTNSGTISGGGDGVEISDGVSVFTNSGTISGSNDGVTIGGGTVINAGRISGGSGTAVDFGGSNNTLKLLSGGSFGGGVLFRDDTDIFDFSGYRGSLILEVQNTSLLDGNVVPGSNLYLQTPDFVFIVGDAGMANSSLGFQGLAGGINDLLDNETSATGSGAATPASNYAATPTMTPAEQAASEAMAGPPSDSPVIWADVIGGGSIKSSEDLASLYGALVVGAHASVGADFELGALAAYGRTTLTSSNSLTMTGDTGVIGLHGNSILGAVALDFSVLAGASRNHSSRRISTAGPTETATADFSGWFVDSTVGLSLPVLSTDDGDLSVGGKLGYLFGGFEGYSETGSSANMTVGAQTIGIFNASLGVSGRKTIGINDLGMIVGRANVDLFTESNVGTSNVAVSVLGTPIGKSLAPSATTFGVKTGLGVDVPIGRSADLGIGANGSLRSDGVLSGSANIKLGGTF